MPNMLKVLALIGSLAAAPAALAIPFSIEITSSEYAAGAGVWSLNGPTSTLQGWAVGADSTYSGGADVLAGNYTWSILGAGVGIGSIEWVLSIGDWSYSGSDGGWLAFHVADATRITVDSGAVSVPEPGTLLLLGSGLVGMALSMRRKRKLS